MSLAASSTLAPTRRESPVRRLRALGAPARRRKPKVLYAIVAVSGAVAIGAAQMALSVLTTQGSYQIAELTSQQRQLDWQKQMLYDDVAGLSSPQYLAANASALGMVINESPSYLRLSDGAILGASQAAVGASSVDAIGRGAVANALITDTPARDGSGCHDPGRAGRARRGGPADGTTAAAPRSSSTRRLPSPTDCRPRAHTETMTTRSTRSQRRRTVVALGVVLAILGGFIVRLVDIQVVSAREHIEDSLVTALGSSRPLYGTRGSIVDETGQTLAGSILLYDAQLDPSNVGAITRKNADGKSEKVSWPELAAEIGEITGQTAEEVQKVVDDARAVDPNSQYAKLKRGLSTEQYRALAALGIPFIYFDPHPSRTYPDGAVAGNLVGYMGLDGDALGGLEQTQDDLPSLRRTTARSSTSGGRTGSSSPAPRLRRPPSTAAPCSSRSTATCSGTCSS